MRNKKAKQIRKKVYGDNSIRQEREYIETNRRTKFERTKTGKLVTFKTCTIVNHPGGLRSKYLKAKKAA